MTTPPTGQNLPPSRSVAVALLLAATLVASSTTAQAPEYQVVFLPSIPDGFITVPTGFNDLGTVVGQTLEGEPLTLKGWIWTASAGLQILPSPPGLSSFRAMDVNNSGVIVGDGGLSWGEGWRLQDGVYEMLGSLPGDSMSQAVAINNQGDAAGTSLSPAVTSPRNSIFAPVGGGLLEVQASSFATDLNEAGQVVGYYTSNVAYRNTPGAGTLTLPPLDDRVLSWAWGINSAGDVVGEAAQANGNGHIPFLFTDSAGMQPIGTFNGNATALDINDRGEVIGHLEAGGPNPWIWTASTGVRFLDDLIDPSAGAQLLWVGQINERGDILGLGIETQSGLRLPLILRATGIFSDGFESGDATAWSTSEQ